MGWCVSGKVYESLAKVVQPLRSSPKPILTKDGEILVLLAGRPIEPSPGNRPSYKEDLVDLESAMLRAGTRFSFSGWQKKSSRGNYRAITTGVSLGCGSVVRNFEPGSHCCQLTVPKGSRSSQASLEVRRGGGEGLG